MKALFALLLVFLVVVNSVFSCSVAKCEAKALKCHTCVASNMEDCNKQGSMACPNDADACSTITGPNSVMKSCSYKSFCDKAHMSNGGVKLECCFTDDCNGPHRAHSYGYHNGATTVASSSTLLMCAVIIRLAASVL